MRPGPPGPAAPAALALWPHPGLSVVPQGAQAAWGLATADGRKDPVGNISPIPDLRDFSNFSRLGGRTDDTQTTPPFLTSSKRSAYKIPPPLPILAGSTHSMQDCGLEQCRPGSQLTSWWAAWRGSTTMATTDRDTEAQRG